MALEGINPEDDLVVATPERVAFDYAVAGPGSRFLAQCIDLAVQTALFTAMVIAAVSLGFAFNQWRFGALVFVLLGFALFLGYFPISEALWSGRTIGKRALRLRVVGDQGEPVRLGQVAVRNLIRIVDFLPVFYGIGLSVMFINGRGKRLGDLAAGTLVVRERDRVRLRDLRGAPPASAAAAAAPTSIWGAPPAVPSRSAPVPTDLIEHLDPALRRFVVAYAGRRRGLPLARRQLLAQQAEVALRHALPELVMRAGVLAALDQLADLEEERA
jgi:uncharacterized RDD family membrane protein YckC